MGTTRRDFLQTAGLASAGLALGARPAARADDGAPMAVNPKHILILGGTSFLGRHAVEAALARGHTVTIFNRGRTNPHLFPTVEKLQGDRDGDLTALEGRDWDAVIDTSGYVPRIVRDSATLLADHVEQYVFVSSISVYPTFAKIGIDESYDVATLEDQSVETVNGLTYGPLKALCEQAAEDAMPGRVTNVRPGLIVGPHDNVPRFTYWPVRIERGGEVLAPGDPNDPVQYIDARDLARWMVYCIEERITGVFNTNGPEVPTSIAEVLYGCKAVTGGTATFTWVDAAFLEARGVVGWVHMPLWVSPSGDYAGFHRVNCAKAIENGLTFRPLADTVRDTLDWYHSIPDGTPFRMRGGVQEAKEREVLEAWAGR